MLNLANQILGVLPKSVALPTLYAPIGWVGTGSSNVITTGIDLSVKGLAWIKDRDAVTQHCLMDTVRGVNGGRLSTASATNQSGAGSNMVTAFANGSVTVGTSTIVNTLGENYIGWFMTAYAGFSDIQIYAGNGSNRTISHALAVPPELILIKNYDDNSHNWQAYNQTITNAKKLVVNSTAAAVSADATYWNSTDPTSSVFSLGTNSDVNDAALNYVAYLFATLAGISKVGTYSGNDSGQNISCGFTGTARFIMIKDITIASDWVLFDSVRGIGSGNDPVLSANSTAGDFTGADYVGTFAGGFALSGSNYNVSSHNYIFLALA